MYLLGQALWCNHAKSSIRVLVKVPAFQVLGLLLSKCLVGVWGSWQQSSQPCLLEIFGEWIIEQWMERCLLLLCVCVSLSFK